MSLNIRGRWIRLGLLIGISMIFALSRSLNDYYQEKFTLNKFISDNLLFLVLAPVIFCLFYLLGWRFVGTMARSRGLKGSTLGFWIVSWDDSFWETLTNLLSFFHFVAYLLIFCGISSAIFFPIRYPVNDNNFIYFGSQFCVMGFGILLGNRLFMFVRRKDLRKREHSLTHITGLSPLPVGTTITLFCGAVIGGAIGYILSKGSDKAVEWILFGITMGPVTAVIAAWVISLLITPKKFRGSPSAELIRKSQASYVPFKLTTDRFMSGGITSGIAGQFELTRSGLTFTPSSFETTFDDRRLSYAETQVVIPLADIREIGFYYILGSKRGLTFTMANGHLHTFLFNIGFNHAKKYADHIMKLRPQGIQWNDR